MYKVRARSLRRRVFFHNEECNKQLVTSCKLSREDTARLSDIEEYMADLSKFKILNEKINNEISLNQPPTWIRSCDDNDSLPACLINNIDSIYTFF